MVDIPNENTIYPQLHGHCFEKFFFTEGETGGIKIIGNSVALLGKTTPKQYHWPLMEGQNLLQVRALSPIARFWILVLLMIL